MSLTNLFCNFIPQIFSGNTGKVALAAFAALLVTCTAYGQAATALHGTVTDPQGAVIAGASVTLVSADTLLKRDTTTGSAGQYEFVQIPPGKYDLSVSANGFQPYRLKDVQLLINTPATVDVIMTIGQQAEVVHVNDQAAPLNLSDASLGVPFSETQVKQIPLEGRNVPDLLSLQAGVVYTGNSTSINRDNDTRSGAVSGARSDQSNVTLDGVDVNDQGRGYAFTSVLPVTLDSVQEFRVTTTNYNADQGRSSGAQVALVTKSGTNQFHGSLYEYLRNTLTSANDYFVKLAELSSGQPNKPPKLIRNIFGGAVGGPVKKDRLFFFANYEGARQREEASAVTNVPTASLRQGIIQYQNSSGGISTLSTQNVTQLDPLHLGPNAAVLQYFNSFPLPNDNSVGDGGLNFAGYRFRGPVQTNKNYYIARVDYRIDKNANHTLFWRGALQNVANPGAPYLPGQAPEQNLVDYSKGFATGYTGVLSSALVNNFRWGYTRQSVGVLGNSDLPWVGFRGFDEGVTRSHSFQMPIHNFVDDLTWIRGRHTLQFGTNIAIVRDASANSQNSFSNANSFPVWLADGGFSVSATSPLNPVNGGFAQVDTRFDASYDNAMAALLGMVAQVNAQYNYGKSGNLLTQGVPVKRRYGFDWYEFYGQDSFRWKPNLTVTLGLRWSLYSPPWETNGLQAQPTISLGDLFNQRAENMQAGIPSNQDPVITFDLAGPANGKPGFYGWTKTNFGPRISLAYSPDSQGWLGKLLGGKDKTVFRTGFGIVYDAMGLSLLNTFNQTSSTGFSTTLTNPGYVLTEKTAPRLTSLNVIPTTDQNGNAVLLPAPAGGFPQTPPTTLATGGFQSTWGLDNKIRTPYSYTFDLSVGHEFSKQFSVDVAYVGRLSRRLLTQEDLMMPLDLVDQVSHIDYFAAAARFSQLARAHTPTSAINAQTVGPTAAYWQNMVQPLQSGGAYSLACSGGSTLSAVQAAYDLFSCYTLNETGALATWDTSGIPDANLSNVSYFPVGGRFSYFNRQYSSLYAWRTIGTASYNALQVTLRRHFGKDAEFDFNYTFSKSIDLSSDASRIGAWSGLGLGIINSWSPNQLRGVSDFDTPHQINLNWIVELPFGRGKRWGHDSSRWVNSVFGGWQFAGLARWTSGFPVNVINGPYWPTNWWLDGFATTLSSPSVGTTKFSDGTVSMFKNGSAAISNFDNAYPGQSGARNTFRGDGYAGLDASLAKRWTMPWNDGQSVQFRWEVFNVPNLTRFDVQSMTQSLGNSSAFGNYTGTLTQPRVMQFALRYEF